MEQIENKDINKLTNDIRDSIYKNNKQVVSNPIKIENNSFFNAPYLSTDGKPSLSRKNYNVEEAFVNVGGDWVNRFPTYERGVDNYEFAAQNQSGLEQAFNGSLKALVNTGTVILGNTVGFVNSMAEWTKTGNFNSVIDNSFVETLYNWNTKLNYQLPNYYTKQAQEAGFLGQLMENPTNTIFNDILNGVSFVVGTITSEALWAYATGGASIASIAGRLGARTARWSKLAIGTEKAAEGLKAYKGLIGESLNNVVKTGKMSTTTANTFSKIGNVFNTTRFIATSSGNEAAIEAFHFKKEATENYYKNFEKTYGRQPNQEEISAFNIDLDNATTGVFGANMAILGISNLSMLGNLFGIKSPISELQKQANKKIFGLGVEKTTEGVTKTLKPTKLQKVSRYLYVPTSTVVREGAFEEAGQGVVNKTANLWIEKKYNPEYINKVVSIMDLASDAAIQQYGTKEGQKDIWIGGIVGLLGAKFTGEFSRFNKEQQYLEDVVVKSENANKNLTSNLVSDIISGRIKSTAFQLEAQDRAEKKILEGDVVEAKLAQYDGLISSFITTDYYDDSSKLVDNMATSIDLSNDLTNEEKSLYKESLYNLHNTYKKASTFAESIVGNQGRIYNTNHSAQLAKESLTYLLVQGNNSNILLEESYNSIKNFLSEEQANAIKTSEQLELLGKDTRRKLRNASQRYRNLEKKTKNIQKKVAEIQESPSEIEGDRQSKLVEMQNKLIAIEDTRTQLRVSIEETARQLEQSDKLSKHTFLKEDDSIDFSEELISVEDLINLDQKLEEVEVSYKNMENINPSNAQTLKSLMTQYQNAKLNLIKYNSAVSFIAKGKFNPQIESPVFASLLSKENDELTLDFLDAIVENRNKKAIESFAINQEEDVQIVSKKEDKPIKKKDEKTEPVDVVVQLEQRVDDILSKFSLDFIGEGSIDERLKDRPDQEDLDRYRELKNLKEVKDYENKGQYPLDTNIIDEYESLKNKLSKWRVYDSLLENKDESVADLLDQIAALKVDIDNTTITDGIPEFNKEDDIETNKSGKIDNFKLTINTNFAPTIKVNIDGRITVTHLKPKDILDRYTDIENILVNNEENDFKKDLKIGDRVTFLDNGIQREFIIGVGGSIEMTKSDFLSIPNIISSNTETADITNWTYSVLYEIDSNWYVIPIKSSFADESITGHTKNIIKGDTIGFYVDINNTYNQKLLKEAKNNDEIRDSVVVYIRKNGENYGTLKGLKGRVGANDKILLIREMAKNQLLSKKSGQIGTTKVERVELGVPILTLDKSGKRKTIPITDRGLENIKASGYIVDGEIYLNKPTKKDVRKSYISKVSKQGKVPIVVIEHGKQLIGFPVKIKKTLNPKGEELQKILDADLSDSQKVVAINKLLASNRISPRKFDLTNVNDFDKLEKIQEELNKVEDYKDAEVFADKDYNISDLKNDVEISLDLENLDVYLPSQKILLDLDNSNINELEKIQEEKKSIVNTKSKKNIRIKNEKVLRKVKEKTNITLKVGDNELQDKVIKTKQKNKITINPKNLLTVVEIDENNIEDIVKIEDSLSEKRVEDIAKKLIKGGITALNEQELEDYKKDIKYIDKTVKSLEEPPVIKVQDNKTVKKTKNLLDTLPYFSVDYSEIERGVTTNLYKKEDGNWYFKDSRGNEQKELAKNNNYLNWLYEEIVKQGGVITNEDFKNKKEDFKNLEELNKIKKDITCG